MSRTKETFTEPEIASYLALSIFHFRRFLIVSNVSGGMLPWEADLLVMSGAGYLSEVEIKISLADLKRDAFKKKWSRFAESHGLLKQRWFAMPEEVWGKAGAAEAIPPGAGVIVCRKPVGVWDVCARVAVPAIENKSAKPLSDSDRYQLARLGVMRYWSKLARQSRQKQSGGA